MNVAGVIIAGGRSSRMGGGEKLSIEVAGRTIFDRIVERVAPQVDELAINANGDRTRFKATGLAIIPDLPDDVDSPLAGLRAALLWARHRGFERLLTIPSDTPFLPRDLVSRLGAASAEAAIAASRGREHFLTGLWATSLAVRHDEGPRLIRMQDWARLVGAVAVEWPVEPCDPFFNVNAPQDLAEAQAMAADEAS